MLRVDSRKVKQGDTFLALTGPYTDGHDYINLFCEICKKHYKSVSITSIEQAFRTSFGPSEFKLTKLYNSLHEYQIKKHLSIVP